MLWLGWSFLLAAAFLLILCIKFANMKRSTFPNRKIRWKTEKVEQTTTDKKEQMLQDENQTLNDKMIDKIMSKLVKNLEDKLDAKLR